MHYLILGKRQNKVAQTDAKLEKIIQRMKELARATMQRQLDSGVVEYTWTTSDDVRVCEACAENNGKVFRWDSPHPVTGHPGEGKCCSNGHCRCHAIPVLDNFF